MSEVLRVLSDGDSAKVLVVEDLSREDLAFVVAAVIRAAGERGVPLSDALMTGVRSEGPEGFRD